MDGLEDGWIKGQNDGWPDGLLDVWTGLHLRRMDWWMDSCVPPFGQGPCVPCLPVSPCALPPSQGQLARAIGPRWGA